MSPTHYSQTPVHQNVTPTHHPYPYVSTKSVRPVSQSGLPQSLSAGFFGFVVVSTGLLGANLHKVSDGDMTLGQAVGESVAGGVAGGVAAATATATASALTNGGAAGLAVTLTAATGVSYVLNALKKK